MKSYIKLYGPPIFKALKALETIAVDMPEVCIMDTPIELGLSYPVTGSSPSGLSTADGVLSYFGGGISEERCDSIISKSGESLGEYDFYFEWFRQPSMNDVTMLIEKIDEALIDLGVKYTITTK
jgi:hypothetical protein